MTSASRLLPLLAGLLLLGGRPAWAADDCAVRHDRSRALWGERRFAAVIAELDEPVCLARLPSFLLIIARAHSKAGHLEDAIRYYERFQERQVPLEPDKQRELEEEIAEVRRQRDLARAAEGRRQQAPAALAAPLLTPPATQRRPPDRRWVWGLVGGLAGAVVVTGVVLGLSLGLPPREPATDLGTYPGF